MSAPLAALLAVALAQSNPPLPFREPAASPAPVPVAGEEPAPPEAPPVVDEPAPAAPAEPAPGSAPAAPAPAPGDEGLPQPEARAIPYRPERMPGFVSLLGGHTLEGGSAAFAWGGWSTLGAAYAQGTSPRDDLGVLLEFDWASTELYAGGLWRRGLGRSGTWDAAVTARVTFWASLGAEHVYSDNARDAGIELHPAIALSRPAARGEVALRLDTPVVLTFRGDNGAFFQPRLSIGYEAPLYGDYTLGVLGGVGLRVGAASAPMTDLRSDISLLLVAGWRLF